MTSITSSGPATAPSTTPVNTTGTPQSPSINPQTSIPATTASQSTSASSPLQRGSLSYAQASRKSATIVSSPAIPTQHSIVTSSPGTSASNARVSTSGSSPVNSKPSIQPAVPPLVAPPPATNSSGNVIVNGSSAAGPSHSRKSSLASQSQPSSWSQQQNGLRMPPGQQPPTPSSIHFGNVSNGPHGTHMGSSPALPPSVPLALSAEMPTGSPQTSPSPAPQPAASGGPPPSLPRQGMPAFGSVTESSDHNRNMPQRPVSMPPNAPLNPNMSGPPAHLRRDSGHNDGPPSGLSHGRGMPQNTPRRNPNQMNNNYPNQVYRPPNQPRSGTGGPMGSPYQTPAHMANYSNQRGGRSPALTHSLPSTPQTNAAQLVGVPPMQPSPHLGYAQHLNPHQMQPMQQMYQSQGYDPNFYTQPYMPYPQPQFMPPGSPRPSYHMPQPPQQTGYMPPFQNPQSTSMARTGSQMSEHHVPRPPSSMSHLQHTPTMPPANIPPPLPHPGPTPSVPSNTNSPFFKKVEKTSKKIEIRDPNTGAIRKFDNLPPTASAGRSPVIVSSSPAPEPSGHGRSESKSIPKTTSAKTDQEVKDEIKAAVQREIQMRKQQEEDEARLKREEEEKKAKEAEEDRLKKEEEERLAKEKEQREKEEAERQAAEEAKAKAEEEERLKREKEEAENKAKAEEEERQRLAEEERKKKEEEAEELVRAAEARRLEEVRKVESPAAGTGTSTPVGPGDDDADAKAVAEAIKTSVSIPPDSKVIEEVASDIAKITVTTQSSNTSEVQPAGKQNQRKPAPLNLQLKTSSEPALPSAALTALRSARFIDDINKMSYPPSIISPNPALNANAPNGKFKYEKDFLMQFQGVFMEKPSIDWDQRMRDTVGEPDSARATPSTRVPSSAGAKGARANLPGVAPASSLGMGSFGMGSKMGQPGNIMSTAGRQPSNPFQMGNMGSYRPSISRTGSSTQLSNQGNSTPQSPGGRNKPPRTGSKRNPPGGMDGRQASQKGPSRNDSESTTSAPLLAAADVKPLVASATRWTPRSVAAATQAAPVSAVPNPEDSRLSPEMVQRKVKAALNKMTPEKFDKIADQILEIASQSRYESDGRSLRQVIQLTFEKATDEPNFSSMYAKFCKRMLESMHPDIKDENIKDKLGNVVTGGALFRKYLLNRCQEEFERGWKVNLPPKPDGANEEAALMSDEYYIAAAAKRRGLGLIQFIGELFKLQMLTERIMHECVKKLVDYEGTPEEEEVESLCKLLRTIGYALDASEKSHLAMDAYFVRIQQMMDSKDLNSRMKYMLLDVIELRKINWESKEADKGPKTMAEIREEAQKAQIEKEAAQARANQRQRSQAGRGDGRSFSQGFGQNQSFQDQRQNQTLGSDELRRLGAKSLRQSTAGGPSLGPGNLFGRSGSGGGGSRKGLGIGNPGGLFPGSDSGPSSRTATPPTSQRESVASTNSFSLLSGHHDGADNSESHDTTSPPNDSVSPPEGKPQSTDANQAS